METTTRKITAVRFDGIDHRDYPDYCDAYIYAAELDGVPMTAEQLEDLNEDTATVYELLMEHLY